MELTNPLLLLLLKDLKFLSEKWMEKRPVAEERMQMDDKAFFLGREGAAFEVRV